MRKNVPGFGEFVVLFKGFSGFGILLGVFFLMAFNKKTSFCPEFLSKTIFFDRDLLDLWVFDEVSF